MAHKLDPYKGIIDARLKAFPKLSAKRLFDEVCAAGYPGSYSRVNDYVRATRPREPVEVPVRFETPAGRQGQVDFGTFTLPWGRRHALLVVLGYSRLLLLHFYHRQTMAVLVEALESAFDRFGGVPEELLFDQMRTVVLSDDRAAGGGLLLNAEFLRFAAHWGFVARSCRPYRARTKGKIERPIRYIRESFFYGRSFANDDDLNEQAARWLEGTANVRRHATPGRRFSPWPTAPTGASVCGRLRSRRHGACRQPWRSSDDRSDSMRRRCNEGPRGGTISAAEAMLNAQIVLRNNRRLQTAMRSSRLPAVKTLDQFDFAFQPSIKREQIESLHELGFLDRGGERDPARAARRREDSLGH